MVVGVGVVGAADLVWNSMHCFGHGLYFLLHVSGWARRCYHHSQLISIAVQTDSHNNWHSCTGSVLMVHLYSSGGCLSTAVCGLLTGRCKLLCLTTLSVAEIMRKSMVHRWNDSDRGKLMYWEKHVRVPLCPPQIPHGLTWYRTLAQH